MKEGRRNHMPRVGIMTLTEVASDCCTNETLLEIYYLKKNYRGQQRYEVEPYEIKDGYLWAFDPKVDTVKRFRLDGIVAIADTGKPWKVDEHHERTSFEKKLARRQDERQSTNQGSEAVGTVSSSGDEEDSSARESAV